jgi:hypothetical protein
LVQPNRRAAPVFLIALAEPLVRATTTAGEEPSPAAMIPTI